MRYVNLDKFLEDLRNTEGDITEWDEYWRKLVEVGYSYELIEQIAERQDIIVKE